MASYLAEASQVDFYSLFIYSIPPRVASTPDASNVVSWLEQVGKSAGDPIAFKPTHCFKFFRCLYELTQLDLLVLVGASAKDEEADEESYCTGCLPPAELEKVLPVLDDLVSNRREEAGPYARDRHDIDGRWFLRTAVELYDLLKSAFGSGSAAMGLFE